MDGAVHPAQSPPSSRHAKTEPASEDENENVAEVAGWFRSDPM